MPTTISCHTYLQFQFSDLIWQFSAGLLIVIELPFSVIPVGRSLHVPHTSVVPVNEQQSTGVTGRLNSIFVASSELNKINVGAITNHTTPYKVGT